MSRIYFFRGGKTGRKGPKKGEMKVFRVFNWAFFWRLFESKYNIFQNFLKFSVFIMNSRYFIDMNKITIVKLNLVKNYSKFRSSFFQIFLIFFSEKNSFLCHSPIFISFLGMLTFL